MATPALTPNNYFSTTLSSSITTTDTTIFLASLPSGNEGYLEVGEGLATKEIIYYTSKGANFVTLPSVGAGRGVGGTSASAHSSGEIVKQKLNAEWWKALQDGTALGLGSVPNAALAANTAWASFTPTLTNLTLGNGTLVAKYQQIGKTVKARISLVFGSTTAVTGDITFTLPVTAATYAGTANVGQIGGANIFDTSVPRVFQGIVNMASTTTGTVRPQFADQVALYTLNASSSLPMTWAVGDEIGAWFEYEAA